MRWFGSGWVERWTERLNAFHLQGSECLNFGVERIAPNALG
jgi:hypothetical protein